MEVTESDYKKGLTVVQRNNGVITYYPYVRWLKSSEPKDVYMSPYGATSMPVYTYHQGWCTTNRDDAKEKLKAFLAARMAVQAKITLIAIKRKINVEL